MKQAKCGRAFETSLLALGLSLALLIVPRAAHGEARAALRFEPNRGQFAEPARYVSRGRAYALFLTPSAATFVLNRSGATALGEQSTDVLTVKLRGASRVEPQGRSALPGRSNYFVGSDRMSWRSDVESFARVRYEAVLPGVDVEYYGTEGRELEYDLLLAAGVSARRIEVEFEGASELELTRDGRAHVHLPSGAELVKEPPFAYQTVAGQSVAVGVRYVLRSGRLGFEVAAHDESLPLVIDPVLTYATYFGGSSFDEANAIASDAGGNTYLVGYTTSTLFPTASPQQPSHGGGAYDAFVVKLDPSGGGLVYATYLGGNGADIAYAVASDAQGNAYIAGLTTSANFPKLSAAQGTLGGAQDGFVAKLASNGSALLYSTFLGGAADDYAKGIAVSNTGAAFVFGTTFSSNFPTAAALQSSLNGGQDAFATQLAASGSTFVYSTYLGGGAAELGNAIALDGAGNAYVAGSTTSQNFPTVSAYQATRMGNGSDAFLSKINAAGSGFVYSTYLGGTAPEEAFGVTTVLGTAIVAGVTSSIDFPLASAAQPVPGGLGRSDAFVTRFDPSGTALLYSTYLGGSGNDRATAVASDAFANAYLTGSTDSADFPLQVPLDGQGSYRGAVDAFVATLTPPGSRFVYATYLGGTGEDRGTGVAVGHGTTYVVGNTRSSDFPKVSPILPGLVGAQDAFVVKLPSLGGVAAPAVSWLSLLLLAGLLFGVGVTAFARHDRALRARGR